MKRQILIFHTCSCACLSCIDVAHRLTHMCFVRRCRRQTICWTSCQGVFIARRQKRSTSMRTATKRYMHCAPARTTLHPTRQSAHICRIKMPDKECNFFSVNPTVLWGCKYAEHSCKTTCVDNNEGWRIKFTVYVAPYHSRCIHVSPTVIAHGSV